MSGKNLLKTWHKFLQTNFNVFQRGAPNIHKQRKYEHIEIQKDFEDIEKKRKHERLSLIEYKKKLKQKLLQQQLELAQNQPQPALEQKDQKLSQEIKQAERIKKAEEYKSFQEYLEKVKDSGKQITEGKDQKGDITAIKQELEKISLDIEKIRNTKQELEAVEKQIEELEPGYILVSGLDKKLVLNAITYYEFQARNLQGILIHPETVKAIETVHYHVEHNLPVRRELLYEVVPELFETELGELTQYERERILSKRPRLMNENASPIRAIDEPPEERNKDDDYFEELKKQEMEFMNFVYNKAGEYTNKYFEHFEQKLALGFHSMEAVLENIENKNPEDRTEIEAEMYDGLQELKRINQDYADLIKLNQAKVFAKQRELYVPEFVKQNEKLQKAWEEKWEEIVSHSFDLAESMLVPDNSANFESQLDRVLKEQRAHDIHDLIQQSHEEYKAKITSGEPIKPIDRLNKDPKLLEKLDVLSGALGQAQERRKLKQRKLDEFQNYIGHAEMPEEGRILLDELTKVLFLNNREPQKYNLTFWAEHFNIDPQKLRNIFNFVSFGIPDRNNEKDIGRVLRFVYDTESISGNQSAKLKEM